MFVFSIHSFRTYKVHITAISCDPAFSESRKSNELIVNTQSDSYQKQSPRRTEKKLQVPDLDVSITSTYDDALEVEWHHPLFSKFDHNVFTFYIFLNNFLKNKYS